MAFVAAAGAAVISASSRQSEMALLIISSRSNSTVALTETGVSFVPCVICSNCWANCFPGGFPEEAGSDRDRMLSDIDWSIRWMDMPTIMQK